MKYLDEYEKYGFTTQKELIVEAIIQYFSESKEEDLAERIAQKVVERIGTLELNMEKESVDENYLVALSFINNL